jgi:hypothetical protein
VGVAMAMAVEARAATMVVARAAAATTQAHRSV